MTDFLYVVGSGIQAGNGDFTTGIGSMRTGHQRSTGRVRINTELPSFQVLAIFRCFGQRQAASVQLIAEAYRCSAVCRDGNLLGIGAGTVILSANTAGGVTDLLDVVGTRFQTSNGDLAAGVGSMRTGHQRGTGRIGVNAEFPAIQVLAVLCNFGQAQAAGIQLVGKADRGCTTCGNGYFLGVGSGAVVQSIDATVRMAQFLDIVSTRRQTGNRDLTTGVGGIGTGNQRGAGTIAVDTKAPICKVFSIFRGLAQTEVTQIGRIETEVGVDTARGCTCQRDGSLIGRTRQ